MAHRRKHASEHLIGGVDPFQVASNSQEGIASSAHITAIEANTTHRLVVSGNPHKVTLEEARSEDDTVSGDINLGGNSITNVSTPTNPSDVVNKSYVDSLVSTGVFWQEPVESKVTTAPPGTPSDGDRYIVPTGATGAWSGQTNYIAEWDATGTQWVFTAPDEGWTLWVKDEDKNYTYNGTTWIAMGSTIDHGSLSGLADDDHTQYHNNTRGDARYYTKTLLDGGQLDNRYFTETEHINVSVGAGDAGKPIVLNASGFVDPSMITLSGVDHGTLSGLNDDDHTQYHTDARGDARYYTKTLLDGGQLDNRYFTETEHINISAGVGDAGKPIVLDASGLIDSSMIDESNIDHGSISGLGDDDHTQYLLISGTRSMSGALNMGNNDITSCKDISAVEGHFSGEVSIKVFSQSTEPSLAADNNMAIWIDTSDTNATYLVFRRGLGDQVLVELAT